MPIVDDSETNNNAPYLKIPLKKKPAQTRTIGRKSENNTRPLRWFLVNGRIYSTEAKESSIGFLEMNSSETRRTRADLRRHKALYAAFS